MERHYVISTVDLFHFSLILQEIPTMLCFLVHLLGTHDDVIGECTIMHGIE